MAAVRGCAQCSWSGLSGGAGSGSSLWRYGSQCSSVAVVGWHRLGSQLCTPPEALANPSLEQGPPPAPLGPRSAAGLCCASRAKCLSGSGPSAQTLGLAGNTVATQGLLRGIVLNSADPLRQRRLLVSVPARPELGSTWALPCVPQGSRAVPKAGATVWLAVEQEQPSSLVWLGVLPSST